MTQIHQLPTDWKKLILSYVVSSSGAVEPKEAFAVSGVCKEWRAISAPVSSYAINNTRSATQLTEVLTQSPNRLAALKGLDVKLVFSPDKLYVHSWNSPQPDPGVNNAVLAEEAVESVRELLVAASTKLLNLEFTSGTIFDRRSLPRTPVALLDLATIRSLSHLELFQIISFGEFIAIDPTQMIQ